MAPKNKPLSTEMKTASSATFHINFE